MINDVFLAKGEEETGREIGVAQDTSATVGVKVKTQKDIAENKNNLDKVLDKLIKEVILNR